ncbi:MAG: hypothetical protein VX185_13780 [Pseudomonadota bacterium]|nr:hypothetical protein [Pseudomonadota bacterium]
MAQAIGSSSKKVENIDLLIDIVKKEYPNAQIRVTGRARTIRRQAELMAQRIRVNRQEFLSTYRMRPHILEMTQWTASNSTATFDQTVNQFELIIHRARAAGALVSNHLSDTARDISWPLGDSAYLNSIEARINNLGATVIREPRAPGGRHWHVDW